MPFLIIVLLVSVNCFFVQVEEFLRDVNSMPSEFVEVAEKACEKERRKLQREERVEEQRLEREARLKLAMRRAQVIFPHTMSRLWS